MDGEIRFVFCGPKNGGNTAQRLNGAGVFTYTKFTPLSTIQNFVGKISLRVLPKLCILEGGPFLKKPCFWLQGGPLPFIHGVITPKNTVITPVTHF